MRLETARERVLRITPPAERPDPIAATGGPTCLASPRWQTFRLHRRRDDDIDADLAAWAGSPGSQGWSEAYVSFERED